MEFDRLHACPTGLDRDPLDPYIEVTTERQRLVMDTSLSPDITIETHETCYWVLRPIRDKYIEHKSHMSIWLEQVDKGYIFLFEGIERNNITQSVIENGKNFVVGAPLILPISNDIVVVFPRRQSSIEASFRLAFQITGVEYPWWERAFIGVDDIWWYTVIIGIPSFILLMIMVCICCCTCSCCCNCCKCCNCGKKGKVGN